MSDQVISVIIPSHDYGHYLPETLRSLQRQTYPHWECIVIDDGSSDNTEAIVRDFARNDGRFVYLYQTNSGPNAARNRGLRACQGTYVQFLDADDLLEPRKFELQVAHLEAYPHVDVVYGSARFFTDEQPALRLLGMFSEAGQDRPWMPEVSGTGEEVLEELVTHNIMVNSSPLVRRRLLEEVGFTDPNLWQAEDWHLWIKCACNGANFAFLDSAQTHALIRSHPASNSKNRWNIYLSEIRMRRKISRLLPTEALRKRNKAYAEAIVDALTQQVAKDLRHRRMSAAIAKIRQLYAGTDRFTYLWMAWALACLPRPVSVRVFNAVLGRRQRPAR